VYVNASVLEPLLRVFDGIRKLAAPVEFRSGFLTAVILYVGYLLLKRFFEWRKSLRTRKSPQQVAREVGGLDERVDAHVAQRLLGDPSMATRWQAAHQTLLGAQAHLEMAKEQKGMLLSELARNDRELSIMLAQRLAAGGSSLNVRTVRDLAQDHMDALMGGPQAWAAYRRTLVRPPSMVGVDLTGLDLSNYDFSEAELYRAILIGTNLSGADLRGADLIAATAVGADLTGANVDGALLSRADLSHGNLRGASLKGVELSRACLVGAHLDGAVLSGSRLDSTIMPDGSVATRWVDE